METKAKYTNEQFQSTVCKQRKFKQTVAIGSFSPKAWRGKETHFYFGIIMLYGRYKSGTFIKHTSFQKTSEGVKKNQLNAQNLFLVYFINFTCFGCI